MRVFALRRSAAMPSFDEEQHRGHDQEDRTAKGNRIPGPGKRDESESEHQEPETNSKQRLGHSQHATVLGRVLHATDLRAEMKASTQRFTSSSE